MTWSVPGVHPRRRCNQRQEGSSSSITVTRDRATRQGMIPSGACCNVVVWRSKLIPPERLSCGDTKASATNSRGMLLCASQTPGIERLQIVRVRLLAASRPTDRLVPMSQPHYGRLGSAAGADSPSLGQTADKRFDPRLVSRSVPPDSRPASDKDGYLTYTR